MTVTNLSRLIVKFTHSHNDPKLTMIFSPFKITHGISIKTLDCTQMKNHHNKHETNKMVTGYNYQNIYWCFGGHPGIFMLLDRDIPRGFAVPCPVT